MTATRLAVFSLCSLYLVSCSNDTSSAKDTGVADQQMPGDGPVADLADGRATDGPAEVDQRSTVPDAGGPERFVGIWQKDKIGEALVVSNDCGDYWRVDFDYRYSRLELTGPMTLKLSHCEDAGCNELDSVTTTLTVAGDQASHEKASDLAASADCTIETVSETRMTLDGDGRAKLRWRGALVYVGEGCGPFRSAQTKGDRCEAIAEAIITRL